MENNNLIPLKMHPRVFAALGADLVTNDLVAVIELVKNSYDAFAKKVWIRFKKDKFGDNYIEIEDNGSGMDRDTIENVWCLVATPFRHNNPFAVSGEKKRRVSGEKGLGRLSVARLGTELLMLTKSKNEECLKVSVNWNDISGSDSMEGCYVSCARYEELSPFKETGTLLRVSELKSDWDQAMIDDLKDNLARLISPFSQIGDFAIYVIDNPDAEESSIKITPPKFLSQPKYLLKGDVDGEGNLDCIYNYSAILDATKRSVDIKLTWKQIYRSPSTTDTDKQLLKENKAICGKLDFEIRAWDISAGDVEEISENFSLKKSTIRKSIKAHKGISVYRDGILVLPKSESSRDWLGLDLRRVSRVGTRLSTSQIVGHVSISADDNPKIEDTSDRERLASNREVKELEVILKAAIGLLENERDEDRVRPQREQPLENLFEELSAEDLLAEVLSIAEEGAPASEAIPLLRAFNNSLEQVRKTIQERFVYYSRMATVGTIAQMLVHEIRNRTTIFGSFLKLLKKNIKSFSEDFKESYQSADKAIDSLERLADTFAPLASRSFRRRKRNCNLKEQIEVCLNLQKKEIAKLKIDTNISNWTDIRVAVDPGELDAVLLNLISNAVYWLSQSNEESRIIEFKAFTIADGNRIRVCIDDSGPGIREEDIEKILWPGVTRKPGGIGMGLTVVAELVSEYGGRMIAKYPGTIGGGSFLFDLPIKK